MILTFLLVFLAKVTSVAWTYQVTWPDGEVTSYSYPRTSHGDCLYDRERDWLLCMPNHGYQSVVGAWLHDPGVIVYVSVRCLQPHPPAHHPSPLNSSCLCKSQSNALVSPSPSPQPATETFHRCQLDDLTPTMLNDLDQLEVLDLSFNLLQRLSPLTFDHLGALRVLSLASNPLRHLPESLFCPLTSLEVLDLRHMQLTSFPGQAFRCDANDSATSSVVWLDASGNHLSEWAAGSLWYLSHLRFLNLSDNLLVRLPPYPLLSAPFLSTLSLDRNLLHAVPDELCEGAEGVRRLSLRSNLFHTLPLSSLHTCRHLTHLDLAHNVLTSLPAPPASLPRLAYLGLAHNRLTALDSPLIRGGNSSLTTLDLSHNDLRRLSVEAVGSMATLVRLYLRDNALDESGIDLSRVFLNLTQLQVLDLSHNHLSDVTERHFAGLTSLLALDLSHNRIRNMTFASDTPLTLVTHLNLSSNQLTSFLSRVVLQLTALRVLDLSDNLLHAVGELHVPLSLLGLDLSHNSLQSVPRLRGASSLQWLHLAHNSIASLDQGDLDGPTGLQTFDLSHNTLTSIHPAALTPLHGLQTLRLDNNRLVVNGSLAATLFAPLRVLRALNLSHNRLADVQVLFQPNSLTTLVILDVSYNTIGRIPQRLNQWNRTMHLEHLSLKGCRLREVSGDAFADLIYLRSVHLQHNRLTHLPLFRTHPGVKYRLQGNPVTCSCHVGWLKQSVVTVSGRAVSTHDYDVTTCRTLPRGHLHPVSDVMRRDFLCVTSSARCPLNCTCYSQKEAGDPEVVFCAGGVTSIPSDLPITTRVLSVEGGWLGEVGEVGGDVSWAMGVEELYLNNSGVTELSPLAFDRLPSLTLLQLDDNHLTQLPPGVLDPLANLTSLSLRGNRLTQLPPKLLAGLRHLQRLDLSYNSLPALSPLTVTHLSGLHSITHLRLSGNPWLCACSNVALYDWLRANASRVSDSDVMYCDNDPGRWLVEAEEEAWRCGGEGEGLSEVTMGVVLIGLPLLVLVLVLVYKFRRVLAAVLYSRLGLHCLRRTDPQCVAVGQRYEVCVLYDHSDRKVRWWVDRVLLPRLTGPSWRLRVHVPRVGQRVNPGSSVVDSAVYSVRQSAVCLVLLSKYFGAHQHTVTCLSQALQQAQVRPQSLVVVTWGELTKQTLECGVRPFLGQARHLPVTAPFFWDRLLHLLPAPRLAYPSRRRSLVAACRFRSLSEGSDVSDDKPDTPCTNVSLHL
ncbi:toll-like receptor 6 [Littorina saxatilis]